MNVLKILNQLYPFHFTKIKFVSLFYFKLKWYNYEDDAEKIDALGIVGKEPGQDLVVTSWASADVAVSSFSKYGDTPNGRCLAADILNHSEIILPTFYQIFHPPGQ